MSLLVFITICCIFTVISHKTCKTCELKANHLLYQGLIQVDLDIGIPILGTSIMGAHIIKG